MCVCLKTFCKAHRRKCACMCLRICVCLWLCVCVPPGVICRVHESYLLLSSMEYEGDSWFCSWCCVYYIILPLSVYCFVYHYNETIKTAGVTDNDTICICGRRSLIRCKICFPTQCILTQLRSLPLFVRSPVSVAVERGQSPGPAE